VQPARTDPDQRILEADELPRLEVTGGVDSSNGHASRLDRARTFALGGGIMLAATLIWQMSSFVFNALSARLLGPSRYGTLAAITALLFLSTPIFVAIQTVASRTTTSLIYRGQEARVRGLTRYYSLRVGFAGVLTAGVLALLSGPISREIHLSSGVPVAIGAGVFAFSGAAQLQRGVLLGSLRYRRYALSVVIESIAKLGSLVVMLVWVWRNENGACVAILVSPAIGLIANSFLLRYLRKSPERARPIRGLHRYSITTVVTFVLLALLQAADTLSAKRYLPSHEAGLYAAISLSGMTVFFAMSGVSWYLFPKFSVLQEKGLDARRGLARALAVIIAASTCLIGAYFVAPQLLILPLFGDKYRAAEPYIGWMGIAFGLYGCVYLIASYLLSQRRAWLVGVLATTLLVQLAGFRTFHSSIRQFIAVQLVVFGVTAVVFAGAALGARSRTGPIPV
jgi:O-antigen/teichoic acid export membrane protein